MRNLFKNLFSIGVVVLWAMGTVAQNTTIRPNVVSVPSLSYDAIISLPNSQRGDIVYDITFECLLMYNGTKWVGLTTESSPKVVGIAQAGGTTVDRGLSVAADGSGNVYVTGFFQGTAGFGTTTLTSAGSSDIFVAKYNSVGTLQWVKQAGGTVADEGYEIKVDGNGNVYITGYFQGIATFDMTNLTSAGGYDIFVAKYNSTGTLQWVQQAGGVNNDIGYSLIVDSVGNAYVTGFFQNVAAFGGSNLASAGNSDIFVAKYNSNGALQWVQQGLGTGSDNGLSIAIDNNSNVYITGFFSTNIYFGTLSLTATGSSDIFIVKYDSSGTPQWARKAGGTSVDYGKSIAVDTNDNIYVTGSFESTATFGTTSLSTSGSDDIFLAKYNSSGTLLWAQKAGGTGSDDGLGLAVDGSGNVYVTGYFLNTATFGTTNLTSAGSGDIFIAKYNSSGLYQWVQRVGGLSNDEGQSVAIDTNGNLFATGTFSGAAPFGPTTFTSAGGVDCFLMRVQKY